MAQLLCAVALGVLAAQSPQRRDADLCLLQLKGDLGSNTVMEALQKATALHKSTVTSQATSRTTQGTSGKAAAAACETKGESACAGAPECVFDDELGHCHVNCEVAGSTPETCADEPDCMWQEGICQYNCAHHNGEPWKCTHHEECHYDLTTATCHEDRHCGVFNMQQCNEHVGDDCEWDVAADNCQYICSQHNGNPVACSEHEDDCQYDPTTAACYEFHQCSVHNETDCALSSGHGCEWHQNHCHYKCDLHNGNPTACALHSNDHCKYDTSSAECEEEHHCHGTDPNDCAALQCVFHSHWSNGTGHCHYNCSLHDGDPIACEVRTFGDDFSQCRYDPSTAKCTIVHHCVDHDQAECTAGVHANECQWRAGPEGMNAAYLTKGLIAAIENREAGQTADAAFQAAADDAYITANASGGACRYDCSHHHGNPSACNFHFTSCLYHAADAKCHDMPTLDLCSKQENAQILSTYRANAMVNCPGAILGYEMEEYHDKIVCKVDEPKFCYMACVVGARSLSFEYEKAGENPGRCFCYSEEVPEHWVADRAWNDWDWDTYICHQ